MATYYWVSGNGTWDATTTTNWAASSGGAGGAGVPTSVDDVVFDANSDSGAAFTVTITGTSAAPAVCRDFDANTGSALDQAMTLSMPAETAVLDCYGSLDLPATNLTWTGSGGGSPTAGSRLRLRATSTGKTVTTNGVDLNQTLVFFNGVGGEWTLGSALYVGGGQRVIYVEQGSFVSGNYNITVVEFDSNNGNTRSVSWGSSTITTLFNGNMDFRNSTNLTFDAGTSQINLTGSGALQGQITFYNVSWVTETAFFLALINNNPTVNNLTVVTRNAGALSTITLNSDVTINGTLTVQSGNTDPTKRVQFRSNTLGTARTITAAAIDFGSGVDFRDITAAGVASPFDVSALQGGDCGGNTDITFPAAKTVYRIGTGNFSATQWAATSGGSPAADQFPLAQDTMVFDANTTTGTHTINGSYQLGTLTMTDSTTVTLASGTNAPTFYGNITLSNAVTPSGTVTFTFSGGSTQTITSSGRTFTQPITVDTLSTVQLADALISNLDITLTKGALDLNNQTVTCRSFISNNTNTRSIAFGTGQITVTGNSRTVLDMQDATNFIYTGTSNITSNYSGVNFRNVSFGNTSGATESNVMNINITSGNGDLSLNTGAVSTAHYKNLNFTGFTGSVGTNGSTNIYGDLIFGTGMSIAVLGSAQATRAFQFVATSGVQKITANGVLSNRPITKGNTASTLELQDNLTIASDRLFTHTAGTVDLDGNTLTAGAWSSSNSNVREIDFGAGKIVLSGSGTVWNTDTVTDLTVTGTPVVDVNNNTATATTVTTGGLSEANSISFNYVSGTYTLTSTANNVYRNLNFTGFGGTVSNLANTIYGNLTLSSTATYTAGANAWTFAATSGTQQITTNAKTMDFPITKSGAGSIQLQDNLTQGATHVFTHTEGTVDLDGRTLSSGSDYATSNSNARTIAFGVNGTLNCQGNFTASTPTNLVFSGTGKISMASASSKTFAGGGYTSYPVLNQAGAGTLTLTGANTFADITNTNLTASQITFPASTITKVQNFTLSGNPGALVSLRSSSAGTQFTIEEV